MTNRHDVLTMYRHDFNSFVPFAFNILKPHVTFLHNWHIDVMNYYLSLCVQGKIKRLIINLPPRYLKSVSASIAFPAFFLGHHPSRNIMCISYGEELVREFATDCQKVMLSPRYRQIFPHVRFARERCSPTGLQLTTGGSRLGVSAGGAITGRGADVIIIDDPIKASDIYGKEIETINQWFDDNVYQRLNNKNEGVIILIMQRLHENDLTGHLLSKQDDWTVLSLPAIAERDEEYQLSEHGIYLRKAGSILHPELESEEKLKKFKLSNGGTVFSAQYQQNPTSPKDSLIKRQWFPQIPKAQWPDKFDYVFQSWDTAHDENEHNDYSVCITFGAIKGEVYIIDVFRKKMIFPDLLKEVKHKRKEYSPDYIIIEEAASGKSLIQSLRGEHIPIKSQKPLGNKYLRLNAVSGMIESGFVKLPKDAPWVDDFLIEITRFPRRGYDDQVDALSQGLSWFSDETNRSLGFMDIEFDDDEPINSAHMHPFNWQF